MIPIFHKRGYENGALKVRFQETGIPSAHKRPQGQGWAMDPEGYSYVTFTRPTSPHFYQGIALKNGAMYVSTDVSDDDYWSNGLRIGRDGSLKVSTPTGTSQGIEIVGGKLSVTGLSFFAPLSDLGAGEVDLGILGTGSATFTRATTATTINSAGLIIPVASGVPRSWYWPDTLAYGGYLAEGARTNLCLQSEDLATTWANVRSSESTNATASPDGTANADKLVEDSTAANTHGLTQGSIAYTAVAHSASIWAKAGERTWFRLSATDTTPTTYAAYFDLATGVIGTVGASTTATITAYPNGWYRCAIHFTPAAGTGSINLNLATADNVISYDGNGTSGAFFWGAQIEVGSFASSYIPTTTASVTRNADVLTYVFAGNADATQGTAYAELGTEWDSVAGLTLCALRFDNAGSPLFEAGTTTASSIKVFDGTSTLTKSPLTSMATASRKRASSWGAGGLVVTGDGAAAATTAFDGSMGGVTAIVIGNNASANTPWFGPIKNVAIYDSQFTNTQLVDMTA